MHDWSFVKLEVEWFKGFVIFTFIDNFSEKVFLKAEGFVDLKVPKKDSWGESVSVDKIKSSMLLETKNSCLSIYIQSGDEIYIEAKSIYFLDENNCSLHKLI